MYSRMDQVKFVKDSLLKTWSDMVCLGRLFFKGCLPQVLLGPFLNTLSQMWAALFSLYLRYREFPGTLIYKVTHALWPNEYE